MRKSSTSSVLAMNCIIFILGMVLLTQFYHFLFHQVFSTVGWTNYLDHLALYNKSGFIQTHCIHLLKHGAPWSNYLFAAGLFICSLACITLQARSYVCLVIALGFFIAWMLNWNDPGLWPFEFSFPALFALLAAFSMRGFSLKSASLFSTFGFSYKMTFFCMVLSSVLLYYFTLIAYNEPAMARSIALFSSITFVIFCLVSVFLLDKRQNKNQKMAEEPPLDHTLDLMIVIIGAMLVMQIYINIFSGTFEINTFRESIAYYANHTNATWLANWLMISANHSKVILPLYAVFEISLSIGLTLLLLRGPVLLLAGLLFLVLAFSELGGSATWPPDPTNLTWQWELLFVTLVSFVIGIQKTFAIKKNQSLKKNLLGDPLYHPPVSVIMALGLSIFFGVALYFMTLTAQFFIGDSYRITACYTGVTFAILLFLLLMMDKVRRIKKK